MPNTKTTTDRSGTKQFAGERSGTVRYAGERPAPETSGGKRPAPETSGGKRPPGTRSGIGRLTFSIRGFSSKAAQSLLNVVLPPVCLHCDAPIPTTSQPKDPLCTSCRARLQTCKFRKSGFHLFSGDQELGDSNIRGGSLWVYASGSPVRSLHRALKYGGRNDLGDLIGRRMGLAVRRQIGWMRRDTLCIPVPSHALVVRERGYNHAALLAGAAADVLRIAAHMDIVRRKRLAPSQSRVARDRRESNVGNVFEVNRPELLCGRSVILVDDVMTTGATLRSMARVLTDADVSFVYAFTMAIRVVR